MNMVVALLSFMKNKQVKKIYFQIDNSTAFKYLRKMGEMKNHNVIGIKQRSIGLSSSESNRNYCSISPKCNKLSGRSSIQEEKGLLRMETKFSYFPTNLKNGENAENRSFLAFVCHISFQHTCRGNQIHSTLQQMKYSNNRPKIFMCYHHFA